MAYKTPAWLIIIFGIFNRFNSFDLLTMGTHRWVMLRVVRRPILLHMMWWRPIHMRWHLWWPARLPLWRHIMRAGRMGRRPRAWTWCQVYIQMFLIDIVMLLVDIQMLLWALRLLRRRHITLGRRWIWAVRRLRWGRTWWQVNPMVLLLARQLRRPHRRWLSSRVWWWRHGRVLWWWRSHHGPTIAFCTTSTYGLQYLKLKYGKKLIRTTFFFFF